MNNSNHTAIIADDLTGAGDASLQFFLKGARVQVSFGNNICGGQLNTEVSAFSSGTRNLDSRAAYSRLHQICSCIIKKNNFTHIYKKIDSLMRGNIASEITAVLEALEYDAAVIFPAFPAQGRSTIGGFQLLNGIPVQRTEAARDPLSPVKESNILNIIRNNLPDDKQDIVSLIPLDVVMKGADAALLKLNELIEQGRKFIIADAAAQIDLEQTALAVSKCRYKVLPAGSAGAAAALAAIRQENKTLEKPLIPKLPKLIISGSASDLTAQQIKKLKSSARQMSIGCDISFFPIKLENIFNNSAFDNLCRQITSALAGNNTAVVHTSDLISDKSALEQLLKEKNLSKESFSEKILSFLAALTKKILSESRAVLITAGGETSFRCLEALNTGSLEIKAEVFPAIPLFQASNGLYIITKSGNLGTEDIFIKILKYLVQHSLNN